MHVPESFNGGIHQRVVVLTRDVSALTQHSFITQAAKQSRNGLAFFFKSDYEIDPERL
jgi:hypothetical protein